MNIHNQWNAILKDEYQKQYYLDLKEKVNAAYNNKVIFPKKEDVFNVLKMPPQNIKIIIVGQDPYHGPNQAHGFSFSVPKGIKPPPSLINIYKEIEKEFGYQMNRENGFLLPWINQGVFLLNSFLTVEQGNPGSHQTYGWNFFTDNIISKISLNLNNTVFMLWGSFAKSKISLIDNNKHLILQSSHPSPFSVQGFYGNNHFKKANDYLVKHNKTPIDWQIK